MVLGFAFELHTIHSTHFAPTNTIPVGNSIGDPRGNRTWQVLGMFFMGWRLRAICGMLMIRVLDSNGGDCVSATGVYRKSYSASAAYGYK